MGLPFLETAPAAHGSSSGLIKIKMRFLAERIAEEQ